MRMVEVRGSSGIGKSAFFAYTIAHVRLHCDAQSFAIFHSGKDQNDGRGSNLLDDVRCSVWINGELKIDKQLYANVAMRQRIIDEYMTNWVQYLWTDVRRLLAWKDLLVS